MLHRFRNMSKTSSLNTNMTTLTMSSEQGPGLGPESELQHGVGSPRTTSQQSGSPVVNTRITSYLDDTPSDSGYQRSHGTNINTAQQSWPPVYDHVANCETGPVDCAPDIEEDLDQKIADYYEIFK